MTDKKYKFEYRKNKSIIEVDSWDVAEMIKNAHDWKPLDDVTSVLLGEAYSVTKEGKRRRKINGDQQRNG
tara:strand:+ start:2528 stop:2737 length:210 start_codon:yes stop_codon:yes gene_type:complete